jgi:hypothetical protein
MSDQTLAGLRKYPSAETALVFIWGATSVKEGTCTMSVQIGQTTSKLERYYIIEQE